GGQHTFWFCIQFFQKIFGEASFDSSRLFGACGLPQGGFDALLFFKLFDFSLVIIHGRNDPFIESKPPDILENWMPSGLRSKPDFGFWHPVEHDWIFARQPPIDELSHTTCHLIPPFSSPMAGAHSDRNLVRKARRGLVSHRRGGRVDPRATL